MNDWLGKAAALPIAFAQVREDPRLDLDCCRQLSEGAAVVMIASGGDTAACLARLPLGRLILVDMNPAQLALTRCKLHLATHATQAEAMEWLGHRALSQPERATRIVAVLAALGLKQDALGPLALVAEHGADHAGRYEFLFAALRARLGDGAELRAAFTEVMSMENLVALFGREATQNPRVLFAEHFYARAMLAFSRFPQGNPFVTQIFQGRFYPGVTWDWLSPESWLAPRVRPEFVLGGMRQTLDGLAAESADFVHLSNILDWLSVSEATDVLRSAYRVLKRGGRVLIRQLNSSLNIPGLASGFVWDAAVGRALELRDRSFFYPEIHLGLKR